MSKKLELTKESADELRELAQKMYRALDEIERSTEDLYRFYQSVEDDIGVHASAFQDMLQHVKVAKDKMRDSVNYLPGKMKETADKIDEYVARTPGL